MKKIFKALGAVIASGAVVVSLAFKCYTGLC